MRTYRIIALTLVLIGVGVLVSRSVTQPSRPAETRRIREHLEGAERLVASQNISGFPAPKIAARTRLIETLRQYTEREVYPQNHDFPAHRIPYFIDQSGTRCAMAYLIESTGDSSLVRRIAQTRNNAYVRELADDQELVAWLDRNGLSADEAARIQPQYGFLKPEPEQHPGEVALVGSVLALDAAGLILNVGRADNPTERRWRGVFGLTTGFMGLATGVVLYDEDAVRAGAHATLVVSGASLLLSVLRLSDTRDSRHAVRVIPSAVVGGRAAPGLTASARF